jgi:hypothetical protein
MQDERQMQWSFPFKKTALQLLTTYHPHEVMQILLDGCMELFPADGCAFLTYDNQSGKFTSAKAKAMPEDELAEIREWIRTGAESRGREENTVIAVMHKQPDLYFVHVPDSGESGTYLVLKTRQPFSETDRHLIREYAEFASGALESARVHYQKIRKSEGLSIMNRLNQLVGQGPFEDILMEIIDKFGSMLGTSSIGVMLYNEETGELVLQKPAFGIWDDRLINQYRVPLSRGGNAVSVFLSGKPSLTNDAYNEPNMIKEILDLFGGIRAVITVPLHVHSRRIGVLHAGKREGEFTRDDLDLLMEISYHLGTILDGALKLQKSSAPDLDRREVESYIRRRLVQGVIKGEVQDLEYWLANGPLVRLPTSPPYHVIGIRLSAAERHEELAWPDRQWEPIERIVGRHIPIFGLYMEKSLLHIVCTYDSILNWKRITAELKKDLLSFLAKHWKNRRCEISMGIGNTVASLSQIQESLKRCMLALNYAAFLPDKIGFYSDMAAWTLIAEALLSQPDTAKEFAQTHLGPLQMFKEEWRQTLELFLLNERNIKMTAEQLDIHPNTVKFRIEKIVLETKLDLEHFETRINLIAAFRLAKLMDG